VVESCKTLLTPRIFPDMTWLYIRCVPCQISALLIYYCKQYYNGDTGDVYCIPSTDEHHILLEKYAGLVGKKQVFLTTFDEAISKSPSAKILLLTNDPDGLIETVQKELPPNMFHVIRGSPDPFFVEFLLPGTVQIQI
jgi:hypothetical protein